MSWIKIFILLLFAVIIGSMASALFHLLKDKGKTGRTLKALKVRITLSIAAFALLILGYLAGWIQPHGIVPPPAGQQTTPAQSQ